MAFATSELKKEIGDVGDVAQNTDIMAQEHNFWLKNEHLVNC